MPDEKEHNLPYFEELLQQTGTTRQEWVVSSGRIAEIVGISKAMTNKAMRDGSVPARRFQSSERSDEVAMWCMLLSDVNAWAKKRAAAAALQNGHTPPAPAPIPTVENRLALVEKALHENTDMLKTLYHEVHGLLREFNR